MIKAEIPEGVYFQPIGFFGLSREYCYLKSYKLKIYIVSSLQVGCINRVGNFFKRIALSKTHHEFYLEQLENTPLHSFNLHNLRWFIEMLNRPEEEKQRIKTVAHHENTFKGWYFDERVKGSLGVISCISCHQVAQALSSFEKKHLR